MALWDNKKIDLEGKVEELQLEIDRKNVDIETYKAKLSKLVDEIAIKDMEIADKEDKINDAGLINMELRDSNKKLNVQLQEKTDINLELTQEIRKLKQVIAENNIKTEKLIELKYCNADVKELLIDSIIGLSALKRNSTNYEFTIYLKDEINGKKSHRF